MRSARAAKRQTDRQTDRQTEASWRPGCFERRGGVYETAGFVRGLLAHRGGERERERAGKKEREREQRERNALGQREAAVCLSLRLPLTRSVGQAVSGSGRKGGRRARAERSAKERGRRGGGGGGAHRASRIDGGMAAGGHLQPAAASMHPSIHLTSQTDARVHPSIHPSIPLTHGAIPPTLEKTPSAKAQLAARQRSYSPRRTASRNRRHHRQRPFHRGLLLPPAAACLLVVCLSACLPVCLQTTQHAARRRETAASEAHRAQGLLAAS